MSSYQKRRSQDNNDNKSDEAAKQKCIKKSGKGDVLESIDNGEKYKKILEKMLPSVRDLFAGQPFTFQDDSAPCHRAKMVKEFLCEQEYITALSWPGNSPDKKRQRTRAEFPVFQLISQPVSERARASKPVLCTGVRLECASSSASASEGLSSSAVDRSWRDLIPIPRENEVYVAFVDIEKSFGKVDRDNLMGILNKTGVDWKERRLLSNLYIKQRGQRQDRRRNVRGKKNRENVGGVVIPQEQCCKYIGVYLNSKLSWGEHVDNVTGKAWRALHFIMRILRKASPKSREIAYLTLVRPLMEYGTTCWDPYGIYQINSLERIQYRAAKFVKGKREDGNDTIKELRWETLENRRRKTRITSLYRAHLGQKAWLDITPRLEKPMYYGRNDHDFKIKCRKQKTDVVSELCEFTIWCRLINLEGFLVTVFASCNRRECVPGTWRTKASSQLRDLLPASFVTIRADIPSGRYSNSMYAQNCKSSDYTDDAALHNTHSVRTGLRNYIAAPSVA
ncbi:hypothetical protein ANN_00797 [Periplaneta americana]|uniref:Reverse transcriptase domain-containing protein n=1 Tax=Periplaneta americana TaxID=6978 RepID=A0ABQ8TRS6_PERAM|nr:hypothetical protein ANN_00797 [Periplaneta americana]